MKRFVLIHYSEIGLKKANAPYFIKKLQDRVKYVLEHRFKRTFNVSHVLRRIFVELPIDFQQSEYIDVLNKVFGIKNYKFVYVGGTDLDELSDEIFTNHIGEEISAETFRVRVKRSMPLPYNSVHAEREVGARLLQKGLGLKVKLNDPDLVVSIEFLNHNAYYSFRTFPGAGGFPSNSQSKLVSLISSGIDSPVASYRMMRRGARVIFVHFSGYPYSDVSERENVEQLVEILAQYQFDTKLYVFPLGEFQKAVSLNTKIDSKYNTVIYRRMMYRVAEMVCRDNACRGLISGDSYGQVASQTPENLFAVHECTNVPLFQPLISFDKEEIVAIAEKIGTYDISKLPCMDSCMLFTPTVPILQAKVDDVLRYENLLDLDEWVHKIYKNGEVLNF